MLKRDRMRLAKAIAKLPLADPAPAPEQAVVGKGVYWYYEIEDDEDERLEVLRERVAKRSADYVGNVVIRAHERGRSDGRGLDYDVLVLPPPELLEQYSGPIYGPWYPLPPPLHVDGSTFTLPDDEANSAANRAAFIALQRVERDARTVAAMLARAGRDVLRYARS